MLERFYELAQAELAMPVLLRKVNTYLKAAVVTILVKLAWYNLPCLLMIKVNTHFTTAVNCLSTK